jgi:proteasome assembly chaperone (PAC2) family protein
MDEASMSSRLNWLEIPDLREPYFIAGFYGWSNAGNVSSDTVAYLQEFLKPRAFATLSDEEFINYALNRPIGHIENGVVLHLESLTTKLNYWINSEGDRDLILFLGKEPHASWRSYAEIILEVIRKLGVKRLYTVGGVQDTISHSAPVLISVVGSSPYLVNEIVQSDDGIEAANYYGPLSIHSYLIKMSTEEGIEAMSLWGHVPAYLQRSPRVVKKLITVLNEAVGMKCPTQLLQQQSLDLDRKINEAIAKDPSLREMINSVEDKKSVDEPSSNANKVIRLNDFLHRDPNKDRDSNG